MKSGVRINARRHIRLIHKLVISALSALTVLTVTILSQPLWLPRLYPYLDVSQSPRAADVIIVLGGSDGRRETYAAELYKQGYAPRMLISGHADSMALGLSVIEQNGIPETALTVNNQAHSTQDEAQQAVPLLRALNARSALIVTDRYHTRRARATFQHAFHGQDIVFTMVSPDDPIESSSNWWESANRTPIEQEYLKMVFYLFRYGVRSF